MRDVWICVLAVALGTSLLKMSAPLLLGERHLPPAAVRVVDLLAPALLAGLVTVALVGQDWGSGDAPRSLGVAVAGVLHLARVPLLLALAAGMAAAAVLRALA